MLLRLLLILSCLFFAILPVEAKRVALVVGNSNYKTFNVLPNPVNDARLMEIALRESGFEVTLILDADQAQMKRAILEFGRTLRKGVDASMFFYAGHGLQVKGENYLIPIDADLQNEDEVGVQTIDVNAFLQTMESAQSPFNIIVLDACRNNPLNAHRGGGGGLAPVTAPKGSFVAYSTAPGKVALDGDSTTDSPYTLALAKTMVVPGMKLEDVFKKTRELVLASTAGEQLPFESTSITGDFYFKDAPVVEQPVLVTPAVPSIDTLAADFDLARSLNSKAGWDLFLKRHGSVSDMRVDVARQEHDKLALLDVPSSAKINSTESFEFAIKGQAGLQLVVFGFTYDGSKMFTQETSRPENRSEGLTYVVRLDESILKRNSLAQWCVLDLTKKWNLLSKDRPDVALCDDQPFETRGSYKFTPRSEKKLLAVEGELGEVIKEGRKPIDGIDKAVANSISQGN